MTIIIIIIIYHLSFVFLFWTDGWLDGWMGSTYHGQEAHEHESESFSVGVFLFLVLFDMVWVWVWIWVWYMVLALGRTKDIRHGTRMKYIYHEEGGDGCSRYIHTY